MFYSIIFFKLNVNKLVRCVVVLKLCLFYFLTIKDLPIMVKNRNLAIICKKINI